MSKEGFFHLTVRGEYEEKNKSNANEMMITRKSKNRKKFFAKKEV
jgi:hypothetical protein